jgi:putative transposon-encoded protein
MVVLQKETNYEKIDAYPKDPGNSPKARFRVYGEELIEKKVKSSGNSGRVYLPLDWVGKHVKIIRID